MNAEERRETLGGWTGANGRRRRFHAEARSTRRGGEDPARATRPNRGQDGGTPQRPFPTARHHGSLLPC